MRPNFENYPYAHPFSLQFWDPVCKISSIGFVIPKPVIAGLCAFQCPAIMSAARIANVRFGFGGVPWSLSRTIYSVNWRSDSTP